jgi:hypothetical protein
MSRTSKYSPEVRDRAVRMVVDHQEEHSSRWAAIKSIAQIVYGLSQIHWGGSPQRGP